MSQQITDEIRVILEIQQSAFKDASNLLFTSLNHRIDEQNKIIYELRHSLEFSQEELRTMKNDARAMSKKIHDNESEISEQRDVILRLQQQIARQEDFSRRKNLRIDGLDELNNETSEQTQVKVQKLIENKMKINDIKIDHAHRLKKKDNQQGPRTVIVQLNNAADRDILIRSSHKLKGSFTFINEDLSDYTSKRRKEKINEMKEARKSGKIAYFVNDKLIVKNRQLPQFPSRKPQASPQRRVSSLVEAFTPKTPPSKHQATAPNSAMKLPTPIDVSKTPPAVELSALDPVKNRDRRATNKKS